MFKFNKFLVLLNREIQFLVYIDIKNLIGEKYYDIFR